MSPRPIAVFIASILTASTAVHASLITDQFTGYDYVDEIGVSGLTSSVYYSIAAGELRPSSLPEFGPNRVNYPGVGRIPSGGHSYDQGILGWTVENGYLSIRLATGMNPLTGKLDNSVWYSQGDVFLDVEDDGVMSHFALLNTWARNSGTPLHLGGSSSTGYDAAQAFHTGGLEGHLVLLDSDDDVVVTQGVRTYSPLAGPHPAPVGLDSRIFAQGGLDLGNAGLTHYFYDSAGTNSDWYVQTWTIPLNWISEDGSFSFSLHAGPTCGNDQIATKGSIVPEPASLQLAVVGALLVGHRRRLKT